MTHPRYKLTSEQKAEVVQRLAGYDPPGAILAWLQEEHGVAVDRSAIAYYDPTRYEGRRCPERWKTLFFATREAITKGTVEIAAANKMVRLRWLDGMARDAMGMRDFRLATHILAQVARELDPRYRQQPEEIAPPAMEMTEDELNRRIEAAAAACGYALVPIDEAERWRALPAPGTALQHCPAPTALLEP